MNTELIINVRPHETRIALVENGTVVEFYLERSSTEDIAGNIYKGRILRVLPGMQAAFVDIGQDRASFLYVADVHYQEREFERMLSRMELEDNGLTLRDATLEVVKRHYSYNARSFTKFENEIARTAIPFFSWICLTCPHPQMKNFVQ